MSEREELIQLAHRAAAATSPFRSSIEAIVDAFIENKAARATEAEAVQYVRECEYGNAFPCNPGCEDFGYCSTKKVDSHPPAKPESQWIRCDGRLPEPMKRDRRNRAGILIRFDHGGVSHCLEVTEYLVTMMKNGPRRPLKFETPMPVKITHWMPIPQPPTNQESGE